MLESALDALTLLLAPERMFWLLLGCALGLVVGLIPGLSGTVGATLLLPFVFGMEPLSGTALLIGMVAVVHTSDTFPSVLIGVPGTSGSQATIMDGYPLAQQGQAGRALSAAFIASMIGGIIGALALFSILSVARPLVLALGSPELFMLALLGLSMAAILSRGSALAGILAGLLGLLLGAVGATPGSPVYRFTFDQLYLYDGIPLAALALGLFALPEIIDLMGQRRRISTVVIKGSGRLQGLRDAIKHRWLLLRTAVLGAAIGFVPGLGGAVTDWIAYGITKQTSRDKSQFGKGDIRGVIGPESANNAKEGGALIPTLLFGVPGSSAMAVLLGGFMLMGLQPGPSMLSTNLEVTLLIVWTLVIANIVATSVCLGVTGFATRITRVRPEILTPVLLVMLVVAAYQSSRHWGDIVIFLLIGVLGWVMKQSGWPRAPLLIGFVLSTSAERYLHLSISRYGLSWLSRPVVIGIAAVIVLVLLATFARKVATREASVQESR